MAKRFIDTNLFNDSWFAGLSQSQKMIWIYFITNCDNAGIIDLNVGLAAYQTGIEDFKDIFRKSKEGVYKNRISHLKENYYFLKKFVTFQYPKGLSKLCKPQKSVIKRLNEFSNFPTVKKVLNNSLETVLDRDKDMDQEEEY